MVTEAQLQSEAVWGRQFVPPNLKVFVAELEVYYDPRAVNIGAYGDYRHLKGYHRSRAWNKHSRHSKSRTYSVSETEGNRSGGSDDAISGVDIVVGERRSTEIWTRVNRARQRGTLPYLRENKLERDPWHVHLGIDRGYSNGDFDYLFLVITGQDDPQEADVTFQVDMPELREGAEGGNVVTAQSLLVARGFPTRLDGEFGPHTGEQTRAMQSRYGAEAIDGIWGMETWTIAITGEDRL